MKRIPLSLKIAYSAFVAVLVPYYWVTYTPWNFMYFCDVALLVTLAGIWTESALLVSTQAVGILLPQTLWVCDFISRAILGVHITGMTGYMFDPKLPLFVRALSSFHGWLPFVLILARRASGLRPPRAQGSGRVRDVAPAHVLLLRARGAAGRLTRAMPPTSTTCAASTTCTRNARWPPRSGCC